LETPSISDNPKGDFRTEAAVEPFAGPVVVEAGNPVSTGLDWTAVIIGLAGGLAIAVLAGVGVAGGRRRHAQPRTVSTRRGGVATRPLPSFTACAPEQVHSRRPRGGRAVGDAILSRPRGVGDPGSSCTGVDES